MQQAEKKGNLTEWMRMMCRNDLFFLATYVLGRTDLDHVERADGTTQYRDWLYERCMEIQAQPDGYLDIWSRDHYKSTLITFLKTIQDILVDPEITVCIYSYSSSTATKFLRQIKLVLEGNRKLIDLFPDILFDDVSKPFWADDKGDRHKMIWSEDGIRVKRKSNAKENTVEASGLVIGQRTGGHYNLLVYDDVVTPDSVTSPEMIRKTTKQWQMSLNTGSSGNLRVRIIGTRYHYADTYQEIIESGFAKLRMYPCVDSHGVPVLYDRETIEMKKKAMGSGVFASQMMCDPKHASTMGFNKDWLKVWEGQNIAGLNLYIIIDPAGTKSKRADYTTMWVIGCGADRNFYVLDLIRDKFDLSGKTKTLFSLVQKYTTPHRKPLVFYEKVSMQSDIEHMEYVMNQTNYRFAIIPVSATAPKGQRIEALEPLFREGRIWFCKDAWHYNWEGQREDMLTSFIREEYNAYPFSAHDDALDSLSRIADIETGSQMAFPDGLSMEEQIRAQLESRGFKFEDAIPVEYEPI
jgi:predicted phage terminase large subunit-like protein